MPLVYSPKAIISFWSQV